MPNRILRDWTDSATVETLSAEGERMFVRLIQKADDYGRYHADVRLVRAGCFPLLTNLRDTDCSRWLAECEKAGLIAVYQVKGRSYLAIRWFRQRLRQAKHKFPPPEGQPDDWLPLDSNPPSIDSDPLPSGGLKRGACRGGDGGAKARAPSSGIHRIVSDFYCEKWKDKYGRKYPFQEVDGVKIAVLVEACEGSDDRAKASIKRYLADTDRFFEGHPLTKMTSAAALPKFLVDAPSQNVAENGFVWRPPTEAEIKLLYGTEAA